MSLLITSHLEAFASSGEPVGGLVISASEDFLLELLFDTSKDDLEKGVKKEKMK